MSKVNKSLTDLIGRTPLLELVNYEKKHELKATLIAKPDSQDALRLSYQKLRNADYTSNMEENKDQAVVIYTYDESNELVRIFIEPNEAMLDAIKKSVPKTAYKVEENA